MDSRTRVLLRVTKARKATIADWAYGAYAVTAARGSLDELRHRVAVDRLGLARESLEGGNVALAASLPRYRDAISRYYYAMYHGMRAVSFFVHGGDDHEQHSELPQHVPVDFPSASLWSNALKSARERRNAADYDPYPKTSNLWRADAATLQADARQLLPAARAYLRLKGCIGL
jgi:uncharacterized protein (UPF0332 family)